MKGDFFDVVVRFPYTLRTDQELPLLCLYLRYALVGIQCGKVVRKKHEATTCSKLRSGNDEPEAGHREEKRSYCSSVAHLSAYRSEKGVIY